ncbi:MAG: isochorismatase family protein [Thermoplasmata archaeon]
MAGTAYINEDDLEQKTQQWLNSLPLRRRWENVPRWSDSALLVIDMQNIFVEENSPSFLPAAQVIVHNINELADTFHEHGGKMIYTRHVQEDGDEGIMDEWWGDIIREGKSAELWKGLDVKGETITKPRYSAFHRTELNESLQGIENVFITGVLTDICCETTARYAFIDDYRVFFLADATATITEDIHLSSLKSLCHGFAEILSCKEAMQRLQS